MVKPAQELATHLADLDLISAIARQPTFSTKVLISNNKMNGPVTRYFDLVN